MKNEKKLIVWILQTGEPLHIDKNFLRPMRAINLTNKLIEKSKVGNNNKPKVIPKIIALNTS